VSFLRTRSTVLDLQDLIPEDVPPERLYNIMDVMPLIIDQAVSSCRDVYA